MFQNNSLTVYLHGNKYLRYEKRGSRTVGQRPYGDEQTLHQRKRGIEKELKRSRELFLETIDKWNESVERLTKGAD